MFSVVGDKLITGDMTSNPRYAITFPALDYIEGLDEESVVAIGSSIIRAATNGTCITEKLLRDDASVYNLGISGANPYTETLQIPALIRANPELVLLDLGPNGLWDYYDDDDLNEYVRFRFTINSIMMEQKDIGDWTGHIRDVDRQWLAYTFEEKMKLTQAYSQESTDTILRSLVSEFIEGIEYSERAPLPDDPGWRQYLMEPSFREPFFEKKSDSEISAYLEEKMPRKTKQGIYNPKPNDTLNHVAYEYIINSLRGAGIPVLLVATPHHPGVYSYLSPGQLDGFNQTFNRFSNLSGVSGVNMFWEEWHSSMFRDRNHLGANGRTYFCERITPHISSMLETHQLDVDVVQLDGIDLSNYLEESCTGSDHLYVIDHDIEFIQAEAYSDCAHGDGIASFDSWQFMSKEPHRGNGYLHALPEDVSQYNDAIRGSRLDFNMSFNEPGEYHVWLRLKGNSYGNDTIGLLWNYEGQSPVEFEKYHSFGWTSSGAWEWEPEFHRSPVSINVSNESRHTLSIFMVEDGVKFDEILITSWSSLNPKTLDVHSLEPQLLACDAGNEVTLINATGEHLVQAENYSSCLFGEGNSIGHRWETLQSGNASGGYYVHALPDILVHMKGDEYGPVLSYDLFFESNGTYYAWLLMRGNSYGNDTVGLAWGDGPEFEELVISSHAWDSAGQWEWEPASSREPLAINMPEAGLSTLFIIMREDGVEVDAILITDDPLFDPIKEW